MSCVFCNLDCAVYITENESFFAIWDKHPVSKGHALIISKRHAGDYFDLSKDEAIALQELCVRIKGIISKKHEPVGFNLAMNCGHAAGQTVLHFHMHVIPRYAKDKVNAFSRLRESLF
ncbi:MAG: HIT family protein [Candidatus Cloacimonetes bacterium HGW-Cloacimonetes-3]|jgi:diadenosine tetraphosphate (Ap4A) HIT family hydrolase|nr:MAG: HIT family protein [Candidatus Cloacimonetes bacterium HGW-Cloacimonetes-3]PKN98393.1 MAG: HIT family protein [Chloroflexi bacterium HGW-Chloroflexi-5]